MIWEGLIDLLEKGLGIEIETQCLSLIIEMISISLSHEEIVYKMLPGYISEVLLKLEAERKVERIRENKNKNIRMLGNTVMDLIKEGDQNPDDLECE